MKIAVVSDTHDHLERIASLVRIANSEECVQLLHLGDVISPFAALRLREFKGKVQAIFGNNDGEIQGLQRTFQEFAAEIRRPPFSLAIAGKSILMLHEPVLLADWLKAQTWDFIFYGHLHQVTERQEGRTLLLNPGDASGWMAAPTFFIVDLVNGTRKLINLE